MIQARAWPVRAMYILLAAALAISLFITAAPAQKVSGADDDVAAEWTTVPTPTTADWLLAPESVIIDYALASAGDVAYAIIYGYDEDWDIEDYYLLKSHAGGETVGGGGAVEDGGFYFDGPVSDLAVSLEVDGERDIAIAGEVCCPTAAIFRCTVTGDNPGDWEDATGYDGWDN